MRLFPACYVLIAVTALLALSGIVHLDRGDLLFAATYTMNYHEPHGKPLGHLWSLGIEEQFYLLWPAMLMLLGQARSRRVLIGVLVVAPLIRLALPILGSAAAFLIWSDALASGCLLAILRRDLIYSTWYARVLSSRWFFLVPAAALAANAVPLTKVYWLLCGTIMNLAIAMSADWAMRNPRTRVGRLLNWPAMCFIGVLSYSLYLWQQLFLNRHSESLYCAFPLNVVLALTAAMVSYLIVEAPLLRLRMAVERRWMARKVATDGQGPAWTDASDQEQAVLARAQSRDRRLPSPRVDETIERQVRAGR
jgi:peptidoglycan/LPS O-acetylase OafA/YrhL